jgi:hypothetical protein
MWDLERRFPGCPGTHYVAQGGSELSILFLPPSAEIIDAPYLGFLT